MGINRKILGALIMGLSIVLIKMIVVYTNRLVSIISNKDKEIWDFSWKISLNWKDEAIYALIFGVLFFLVLNFGDPGKNASFFGKIIVPLLMWIFINCYNFIVRPVIHFLVSNKYKPHQELQQWIDKQYGPGIKLLTINAKITNAYATGILPFTKTILLGRPLLEKMDEQDMKCIALHELGHLKNNHMLILFIAAIVNSIIFVSGVTLTWIYIFPLIQIYEVLKVVITIGCFGLFQFYLQGVVQRMLEYKADRYAADRAGAKAYNKALAILHELIGAKKSKGNIDHPPLKKRMAYVQKHCK